MFCEVLSSTRGKQCFLLWANVDVGYIAYHANLNKHRRGLGTTTKGSRFDLRAFLLGHMFLFEAISLQIHRAPKVWPVNGAQWKPNGDQMQSVEAQMELK